MLKLVVILATVVVALSFPTNKSVLHLNGRIVGGSPTDIQRYPYALALLYRLRQYCGAVLIHFQWAITGAQCLEGADVANMALRAGSSLKSSGGEIVDVRTAFIHPEYNLRTADYDFALLLLQQTVSVQNAHPVLLPAPNYTITEGDLATIVGWGTLSDDDSRSPEILHAIEVPVVNQERCQRAYAYYYVSPRMFCTGLIGVGGKDSCVGDAGGPVTVNGYLVGLVSWGNGCGLPDYPGVQASVPSVLSWIRETSGI